VLEAETLGTPAPVAAAAGRRVGRRRELLRTLELWVPLTVLILLCLACFFGPAVFGLPGPEGGDLTHTLQPPLSPGHLLGTDNLGYDELSRILYGGRVSLEVGFGSVLCGLIIGGAIGTTAGYRGGVVDVVLTRLLDMLSAFPVLALALTLSVFLGPNIRNEIFAITAYTLVAYARLARAETLRVRDQNYVTAAEHAGRTGPSIVIRHFLPNIGPQLISFGLLTLGVAVVVEAGMSFLGAGVPPPAPSWGNLIAQGEGVISTDQWLVIVPSAFLVILVLSANLAGDALRARWGESS
jgi:peptide/nickel transport system permease protein